MVLEMAMASKEREPRSAVEDGVVEDNEELCKVREHILLNPRVSSHCFFFFTTLKPP